jgi:hypothetical protein
MEKMEGKTESLEMVNENNGRLLTELDSLVNKLQISYEHQVHIYFIINKFKFLLSIAHLLYLRVVCYYQYFFHSVNFCLSFVSCHDSGPWLVVCFLFL